MCEQEWLGWRGGGFDWLEFYAMQEGSGTSAWNLTATATGNNLQINATGSSTLPASNVDWLAFIRITAVK